MLPVAVARREVEQVRIVVAQVVVVVVRKKGNESFKVSWNVAYCGVST